eukprot:jgi/Galph1/1297/GphlegSOOS_G6124.1
MAMTQKTTTKVNICSTAFLGTSCTDILILKIHCVANVSLATKPSLRKRHDFLFIEELIPVAAPKCSDKSGFSELVLFASCGYSSVGNTTRHYQYCLDYCSPELLNFYSVWSGWSNVDSTDKTVEKHQSESILMGRNRTRFVVILGYALQSVGLQTTNANKSGFLLYLNVKFVPLIAWLFYGRRISRDIWFAAAAALFGTLLLSFDSPRHFQVGDVWCIASAVASAMFILRLDNAAKRYSSTLLNAISLWTVTLFSFGWLVIENIPLVSFGWFYDLVSNGLFNSNGYVSCIWVVLLLRFHKEKIPAEKIQYMEHSFHGFWLNEELSFQASFGALFIVGAAIYSA